MRGKENWSATVGAVNLPVWASGYSQGPRLAPVHGKGSNYPPYQHNMPRLNACNWETNPWPLPGAIRSAGGESWTAGRRWKGWVCTQCRAWRVAALGCRCAATRKGRAGPQRHDSTGRGCCMSGGEGRWEESLLDGFVWGKICRFWIYGFMQVEA